MKFRLYATPNVSSKTWALQIRRQTRVVLIHGWPSSAIEYLKVVEPLTNPTEGQAFHLVIPTQPAGLLIGANLLLFPP